MNRKKLKSALHDLQQKQAKAKRCLQISEHINKKKQHSHPQKRIIPYSKGDKVLLVGEANFSFASALVKMFTPSVSPDELEMIRETEMQDLLKPELSITATTYDSLLITAEKYPDFEDNIQVLLKSNCAVVMFEVDGTNLEKSLDKERFDKIVFNFPHVGLGIKDQTRNIRANQMLIQQFLGSSINHLKSTQSEIHVTIKGGAPYEDWNVKGLAKNVGLSCKTSFKFDPTSYPGYAHRRTLGFKEGLSKSENEELKDCRTFIFTKSVTPAPVAQVKGKKRVRHKNESDSE